MNISRLVLAALICTLTIMTVTQVHAAENTLTPMIEEIKEFRKANNKPNIIINDIIDKYIKKGQSFEEVHQLLTDENFKVIEIPSEDIDKEKYDQAYMTTRHLKFYGFLGFGDELRINFYLHKGIIQRVHAQIIYNAL